MNIFSGTVALCYSGVPLHIAIPSTVFCDSQEKLDASRVEIKKGLNLGELPYERVFLGQNAIIFSLMKVSLRSAHEEI